MEAIKTEEYRGCKIDVYYDDMMGSPREEYDNLGTIVAVGTHRRRGNLGDTDHGVSYEVAEKILTGKLDREYIWLPIFAYEHGGIALSTGRGYPFNCPWDSYLLGFICVEKSRAREEYGWKVITKGRRQVVEGVLRAEVKEYGAWLNGECYGWTAYIRDAEFLGSCGGYIGDMEYMMSEARANVDEWLEEKKRDEEYNREWALQMGYDWTD